MEPTEYNTLRALEDRFWWYRALHRLIAERARRLLRSAPSARKPRVLDAGCGTGGLLVRLGLIDADLHGLELHPLGLAHARERGLNRLCRGSVSELPYRDGSFDLVISLDVLYHRSVRSDLEALREMRRVLRPGGGILLNLPAYESLRSSHDEAIHTARRYRQETLIQLLRDAGFAPTRVSYRNSVLFPVLAWVRWLRRGHAGHEQGAPQSDVRPLPPILDAMLFLALDAERPWLRRFGFPFGLSLLAEARRDPGS